MSLACRYIVALDDPKTAFRAAGGDGRRDPGLARMQWLPFASAGGGGWTCCSPAKPSTPSGAKRMGLADQAVPLRIFENTARMITLEAPPRRKLLS